MITFAALLSVTVAVPVVEELAAARALEEDKAPDISDAVLNHVAAFMEAAPDGQSIRLSCPELKLQAFGVTVSELGHGGVNNVFEIIERLGPVENQKRYVLKVPKSTRAVDSLKSAVDGSNMPEMGPWTVNIYAAVMSIPQTDIGGIPVMVAERVIGQDLEGTTCIHPNVVGDRYRFPALRRGTLLKKGPRLPSRLPSWLPNPVRHYQGRWKERIFVLDAGRLTYTSGGGHTKIIDMTSDWTVTCVTDVNGETRGFILKPRGAQYDQGWQLRISETTPELTAQPWCDDIDTTLKIMHGTDHGLQPDMYGGLLPGEVKSPLKDSLSCLFAANNFRIDQGKTCMWDLKAQGNLMYGRRDGDLHDAVWIIDFEVNDFMNKKKCDEDLSNWGDAADQWGGHLGCMGHWGTFLPSQSNWNRACDGIVNARPPKDRLELE